MYFFRRRPQIRLTVDRHTTCWFRQDETPAHTSVCACSFCREQDVHIQITSEQALREMAKPAWNGTRAFRGRLHHGITRCPQQLELFRFDSNEGQTCHRCSELMELALLVGVRKLVKAGVTEIDDDDLRARSYRLSVRWAQDARDKLATELGMTARLSRLPKAKWFVTAVPDAVDQQIVIDAAHYARSGDEPDARGQYFPYERFAGRFQLPANEVRDRLLEALSSVRSVKPEWVDDNIIRPLSRRAAEAENIGDDMPNDSEGDDDTDEVDDE